MCVCVCVCKLRSIPELTLLFHAAVSYCIKIKSSTSFFIKDFFLFVIPASFICVYPSSRAVICIFIYPSIYTHSSLIFCFIQKTSLLFLAFPPSTSFSVLCNVIDDSHHPGASSSPTSNQLDNSPDRILYSAQQQQQQQLIGNICAVEFRIE